MHHRRCPGMIVPGHRAVRAPRPVRRHAPSTRRPGGGPSPRPRPDLAARPGPPRAPPDRHADGARGGPAALAGQGGPPGRAVWLGPGDPLVCQVVLPPTVARGRARRPAPPRRGAFRLHPLPDDVGPADLDVAGPAPGGIDAGTGRVVTEPGLAVASTDRDGTDVAPGPRPTCGPVGRGAADVAVGRGGDDGRTLWMDVARGALGGLSLIHS